MSARELLVEAVLRLRDHRYHFMPTEVPYFAQACPVCKLVDRIDAHLSEPVAMPPDAIADSAIDTVIGDDDFQLSTEFFRKLCRQAKEANALRAARGELSEARIREIAGHWEMEFLWHHAIKVGDAIESAIRQALGESKP